MSGRLSSVWCVPCKFTDLVCGLVALGADAAGVVFWDSLLHLQLLPPPPPPLTAPLVAQSLFQRCSARARYYEPAPHTSPPLASNRSSVGPAVAGTSSLRGRGGGRPHRAAGRPALDEQTLLRRSVTEPKASILRHSLPLCCIVRAPFPRSVYLAVCISR